MSEEDSLKKARTLLLRYLTYRSRTGKEAADYLQRKGYGEDTVAFLIQEMQGYGYIDDDRYIKDFSGYRKANNFGPRRIRHELLNKGIDRFKVESVMKQVTDENEEMQIIIKLLNKRIPADNVLNRRWLVRQISYLQRRGFRNHLILSALREYGLYDS